MGKGVVHRCLLCRRDATSRRERCTSCATSFCTIFGLSDSHPFQMLFEKAYYCDECAEEVHAADVTLGKLEILKQSLLRFQTRVYTMLGGNYFQIKDGEGLEASYKEFESGGEGMRGRKFSYDEITKIVYEKIDKECFKWERFSSEGKVLVDESTTATSDFGVQTDDIAGGLREEYSVSQSTAETSESVWNGEDDYDDGGASTTGEDPGSGGHSVTPSTSMSREPNLNLTAENGPSSAPLTSSGVAISFDQKIKCTYVDCERYFYDDYNLQIHIKSIHLGNPKPYECPDCKKSFVDAVHLKGHRHRVHTSLGLYVCDQCGKGCSSQSILRNHVRKIHDLKVATYRCYFCSANSASPESLAEHENRHRNNVTPFACLFCPEIHSNSASLTTHYSNNHTDGKFRCGVCKKLLATENGLRLHMISHTETYKCDLCPYAATGISALNNHKFSHTTERAFTCEECGVAYKYLKNLNAHKRVHTGVKAHVCQICNAAFRERSYLKRHEESHSTVYNYQCHHCEKRFKVGENLKKHLRLHNGYTRKPKSDERSIERTKTTKKTSLRGKSGIAKKTGTKTTTTEVLSSSIITRRAIRGKKKVLNPVSSSPSKAKRQHHRNKSKSSSKTKSKTKKVASKKRKKQSVKTPPRVVGSGSEPQFQLVTGGVTNDVIELNNAVASIESTETVVVTVPTLQHLPDGLVYTTSSGVYTNHFQSPTIDAQELMPITVISTQSQDLATTSRSTVQYQFGYNLG